MSLAVRPQTGPSLVWTVVAVVHDGDAACAAAEVPPTAVTVIPATRAAAAAMNVTARSGRLCPSGDAGLILFHVIVNAPQTGVSLGSPLGRLPVPMTAGAAGRPAAWPVLAVAFRGAARIRPHLPGFFPGPSPSAGLYPLLVRGAAGSVTPGDRVSSMAVANAAAANPRSTRPGSTRCKRVSRLAYVRSWRREIGLSLVRLTNLFRYTRHPHSG